MFRVNWGILLVIILVSFSYLGCENTSFVPPVEYEQTLTIGLIPEQNVFDQKRRYQSICDYLSPRIGAQIETRLIDKYDKIYEEMKSGKIDAAFLGSFASARALNLLDTEVLARPVWPNGDSTYRGYIFVLKDSGITSQIDTWRNKKIGLVNKHTSAGYLFPVQWLKNQGVANPIDFLEKQVFLGSHDAVVAAVLAGSVDIGACKNTIFDRHFNNRQKLRNRIEILAESNDYPSNGLIVKKSLDPRLQQALKTNLLQMNTTPGGQRALKEFRAIKFIPTSTEDYQDIFDSMAKLGLPDQIAKSNP